MGRKTTDITAGSLKIRIEKLSVGDAPLGLARAGRVYGPTFASAGNVERMVHAFYAAFNDADFLWLRDKFLKSSKLLMDSHLSNGGVQEVEVALKLEAFDETESPLGAQLEWIAESINFNFRDFLAVRTISVRSDKEQAPDNSTSQNGSTGASGESSPPDVSPQR